MYEYIYIFIDMYIHLLFVDIYIYVDICIYNVDPDIYIQCREIYIYMLLYVYLVWEI